MRQLFDSSSQPLSVMIQCLCLASLRSVSREYPALASVTMSVLAPLPTQALLSCCGTFAQPLALRFQTRFCAHQYWALYGALLVAVSSSREGTSKPGLSAFLMCCERSLHPAEPFAVLGLRQATKTALSTQRVLALGSRLARSIRVLAV